MRLWANQVRQGIIASTHAAKSGHPGGSLSIAEALVYLYFEEMNLPSVDDPDRDRFVLSKGHAAPALYSVLACKGILPWEDLLTLRHIDSYLQGHPNLNIPGIDMSTGSLGQGVSAACGMAEAAKYLKKDLNVYAILGDGECQEGQVWEAINFAAQYKLDNLCILIDLNGLQIDGRVDDIISLHDMPARLSAAGWNAVSIDGNSYEELETAFAAFHAAKGSGRPTAVCMKTVKGKGVSFMEDQVGWHGKGPNDAEYENAMKELKAAEAELRKAAEND